MIRKITVPVSLFLIVSVYIYIVLGVTGLIFGKANANSTPELLHKDWVFQHSIIDETTVQHFTFVNASGQTVSLQRLDNDKWTDLYEHTFSEPDNNVEQSIEVNIPSPSEKGVVEYRIVSGKYTHQTLHSFSVENHDPNDYSDYIKQAYDEIEQYCGNVFITVGDTEHMESFNAVGLAHSGLNKIDIKEGLDKETVEWVANHECGHILQHRAYDKDRENYPLSEKRSILWLNDDLTPYYDEKYENDRGTGFSEKNADCIGAYISDRTRLFHECKVNQAQAAHNIVQGKTAASLMIQDNIVDSIRLKNSGFAIAEAVCEYDSGVVVKCSQKFEAGTAVWEERNGGESLSFVKNNGTISFGIEYFLPSMFESYDFNSEHTSFEEVFN